MVLGDYVEFDYFVIIMGMIYFGLSIWVEFIKLYEDENMKFLVVNFVFVIGGGFVGVEFVVEILVDFLDKKVCIWKIWLFICI